MFNGVQNMLLPLVLFGKVKDLKSVILLENRVYINPFQPAVHFEYKPIQKQSSDVFCKKAALKNFTIFTGKHLCWSLFLIKLQAFTSATLLK